MSPTNLPRYPELLSLAVHELRTPASVVGGYLRMLQKDSAALTERQRKMIDEAEKSCTRIVALIAELSDVQKLDVGLISLALQPLDVFSLVEEVAGHVQEAKDRDVRLEARGPAAGATIAGDAPRLRNAIDAIFRAVLREKAGPCLVVAERRLDSRDGKTSAVIVVAEDGRVQEAYDSAPGAFEEKRGGLGLALPLARRVVEGLGGRIWSPAIGDLPEGDALARGSVIMSFPVRESSR
jgi:two-component system OmpR family sensor kinase